MMDTKALRQKILDLAIRGKLVPQDPNDEPASVLLERIRIEKQQMVKDGRLKAKDVKNDSVIFLGEDNLHYEKFTDGTVKCIEDEIPFDAPEGWGWARLGSIAETDLGKMLDVAKNKGVPRPYLRNINVRWGSFDLSDILEMRIQDEEVERYSIRKGDLVVCEGGEPGRCAIWEAEDSVFFQKALHRVRPYLVLSEYLFFVITAFTLSGFTEHYFTGTTIKHLTGQALKALLIPVPPIREQQDIRKMVSKALEHVDYIENNRTELVSVIAAAKASILDLAIRGQLVPQNPDDEPAVVLLQRIRMEKEALIKAGKIKRDNRESVIFRGEDNSYYETIAGTTECIDEEIPYEIPDSWSFARLESVYMVNPKNDVADDTTVSFVPMTLVDDQYSGQFRFEEKPWKDCKKGFTHFAEGDVGFAKISPCFENRKSAVFSGLINGYGAGTTELYILRSYCGTILPEFTINFVKSGYFINRGKGTFSGVVGQQRIDKTIVLSTLVPIPPVNEQKRIADRVSAVFFLLDSILSAIE